MTTMAVQVDIGAALKDGFSTAFTQATTATVKLDNAIQAVDTRIVTMKGWAAAKKETAAAREEWQRAEAKAKALANQLAATANPTEDLKNKVESARRAADGAKQAFTGAGEGLRTMDARMKAAGVSIKAVKTELDAAERSMAALTQRKEALGKAMAARTANAENVSSLKGQLLGTTAMGAALAVPINKAIEFETAMADVQKAVTFEDAENGLKNMQGTIMQMARDMPVAHAEIAAIITSGAKAGVAEKDLRVYADTISKLSVAWEMQPEAVGQSMGKIGNVLHIGMNDLMLVGDAINKLADSGTSNESEIVDVLKRISGLGLAAHMSAPQLAALSATFIDLGAAPEVAATGINAMINKLLAAPAGTKKFKEGLKEIGWTAEDMQKGMLTDAQGTLIKFLEATQALDEGKRMNLMAEMFGAEYSDDMARLIGGLDTYKSHLKLVSDQANYAGSTMQNYAIYAGTTASKLKMAENVMNEGAIKSGGGLLPIVKEVADTFGGFAMTIGDLAATFPTLTKTIIYTAAAFAAYKVAKLAVAFAWGTVKGAYLDARVATERVASAVTVASTRMRGAGTASRGLTANVSVTTARLRQLAGASNAAGSSAATAANRLRGAGTASQGLAANVSTSTARLRQFVGAANAAAASSGRLAAAQGNVQALSLGDMSAGGRHGGAGRHGGRRGRGRGGGHGGNDSGGGLGEMLGDVGSLIDPNTSAGEKTGVAGSMAGAWAGAAAGAAIGSVVPVVGTAIGGAIGGALGAWGGEKLGAMLGDMLFGGDDEKGKEPDGGDNKSAEPVNDNAGNDNDGNRFQAAAAAAAGRAGPRYNLSGPITISVQAAPGQNPEAVAGAVKKSFEASTSGGEALYDE